jgi:hypothetical protein
VARKIHGHSVTRTADGKAKVTVTDVTPSRAARRTTSVPAGDYAKEGLGARVVDGVLRKLGL